MKGKMMLALLFLAGLAFAIQPAEDWTVGATGKYSPTEIANVTTEGGNVTEVNLTGNVSTEKWAGFWGEVNGTIVLSPGVAMFYTWPWTAADGGEICAVVDNGFDWANLAVATGAAVDGAWNFAVGDTDSASNTFTDAACALSVAGSSINTAGVTTLGAGAFQTCAATDGGAAKEDIAFCVGIQEEQGLFNGGSGDFQLLTATNETASTFENYNFWLELN